MPAAAFANPALPAVLEALLSVEGATTVVRLCGEVDIATVSVVVDTLAGVIARREGDVVVDLAETAFIDTAGLRAIVRARGVLAGGQRTLTLRSPSPIARRLLDVFRLSELVGPVAARPMVLSDGVA